MYIVIMIGGDWRKWKHAKIGKEINNASMGMLGLLSRYLLWLSLSLSAGQGCSSNSYIKRNKQESGFKLYFRWYDDMWKMMAVMGHKMPRGIRTQVGYWSNLKTKIRTNSQVAEAGV